MKWKDIEMLEMLGAFVTWIGFVLMLAAVVGALVALMTGGTDW